MLVLFCVQVVQTNKNEPNGKKRKHNFFLVQIQKKCELAKKAKKF